MEAFGDYESSQSFANLYLYPIRGALWSVPDRKSLEMTLGELSRSKIIYGISRAVFGLINNTVLAIMQFKL